MTPRDFHRLSRDAPPPVHVLVELRHPDRETWFFTNDSRDVEWGGNTYRATAMRWGFPESRDGIPQGGTFEISVDEAMASPDGYGAELLRWFDMADHRAEIVARAIINDGDVTEIAEIAQGRGTATWDGRQITWNPEPDDRLSMHLNPWTFDSEALLA